jgi:hypothetical protein
MDDSYMKHLAKEFDQKYKDETENNDFEWRPVDYYKQPDLERKVTASYLHGLVPEPPVSTNMMDELEKQIVEMLKNTAQKTTLASKLHENYQCEWFLPSIMPGHVVDQKKAALSLQERIEKHHQGVKCVIKQTPSGYYFLSMSWLPPQVVAPTKTKPSMTLKSEKSYKEGTPKKTKTVMIPKNKSAQQ